MDEDKKTEYFVGLRACELSSLRSRLCPVGGVRIGEFMRLDPPSLDLDLDLDFVGLGLRWTQACLGLGLTDWGKPTGNSLGAEPINQTCIRYRGPNTESAGTATGRWVQPLPASTEFLKSYMDLRILPMSLFIV